MHYSLFTYITPFNILDFEFVIYYLDVLRLDCTKQKRTALGRVLRWNIVRLRVIPYNDISLFGDNLGALYVW
jgi:hypothetical protein